MPKFTATKSESYLIRLIARRAFNRPHSYSAEELDHFKANMELDIEACHCNGCKLDLEALLTMPDFDFFHDVGGISKNVNRITGAMENCFLPRSALGAG